MIAGDGDGYGDGDSALYMLALIYEGKPSMEAAAAIMEVTT